VIGPVIAALVALGLIGAGVVQHQAGVPRRDLVLFAAVSAAWCTVLAIAPFYSLGTAAALAVCSHLLERWRP